VGSFHACALDEYWAPVCWGQLGKSWTAPPEGAYMAIAAGERHNCAVDIYGAIRCWGHPDSAGLQPLPAGSYVDVAVGADYTCGLDSEGVVSCVCQDCVFEIPYNDTAGTYAGTTYLDIHGGLEHVCGLTSAGLGACWGEDSDGQTQVQDKGSTKYWQQVVAGYDGSCGLDDGSVSCWGKIPNP